ncbi:tripartite tricarboxylate transporter permease [Neorhizobium sp. T786]|uniref:tripartite tricarboxylate transporter permease n=1 Tax=Pseudorhizobium xiangyangii TaxID=2883104 RepID=UPI001CFF937C|nr:tripartite tricarboxylate transporter permease [Neorhizobium xiangyangii]MCB5204598.1 tripartite tricarboxylate transporter permease [Neorhizobium xiangyangii]
MMEFFGHLGLGFAVALTMQNIILCFVGCLVGTLIGVLPGIGPIATISILLPLTFGLEPTSALIMLAGIYYGAQYGGSTASILLNIPGESSAVVTALDGHAMARKGRAGVALGISAIGSFFAGCFSTLLMAAMAIPLASIALIFGPAEYFSMMVMGLAFAILLARGSILKAILMVLVGLLLAGIGPDLTTGQLRMTFSQRWLSDGIEISLLGMGLFGMAEVFRSLEHGESRDTVRTAAIGRLLPNRAEMKQSAKPIMRGTLLGSILGLLPGNGAVLAPFASYTLEKRLAKDPSRFGHGAIEGVAGPESANNAGAQTSFIPLLTLGIPPNAVMAVMVGAMTIHGIVPGPQIISKTPDIFWGIIASMWIGNLMLLVINLPLVGLWVKLLKVPYRLMFVGIMIFCCLGVYFIRREPIDILMLGGLGIVGYGLAKLNFEPAPLTLGFVLGRMMEENLRQALIISRGDILTFVERPISLVFLLLAIVMLGIGFLPKVSKRREEVFVE